MTLGRSSPTRTRGARAHAPVDVMNETSVELTNPESITSCCCLKTEAGCGGQFVSVPEGGEAAIVPKGFDAILALLNSPEVSPPPSPYPYPKQAFLGPVSSELGTH